MGGSVPLRPQAWHQFEEPRKGTAFVPAFLPTSANRLEVPELGRRIAPHHFGGIVEAMHAWLGGKALAARLSTILPRAVK